MRRFYLLFIAIISSIFCIFVLSCANGSFSNLELVFIDFPNNKIENFFSTSDEEDYSLDNSVNVIILAGQSNATGVAYSEHLKNYLPSETFDMFSTGCENVYIMGYTDWSITESNPVVFNLQKVRFGFGAYVGQFGLEIGIADVFKNQSKKTIIIKYTSPGNYIDFFVKGENISSHFESFINSSLATIKNKGFQPTVKALCWMQGESDSSSDFYAAKYEACETILVNDIRKKFGENIIFVDAYVTDWDLVQPYNFQVIVNKGKVSISNLDSKNNLVDSSGLTKYDNDPCHYDAKSEFELGVRMGEILKNIGL